ncbi:DUF3987 domain-containing protein [Planctomyces sp. SH-PL62]|uniref:DUF3987 domain-containing protein n=1 Tax=Planctomyces sp. SH-PL62 TaxID=1636152 RepID=UPI00078DE5E8|nr:DUF3987 domain-containing protein [Planctomyces sp. SH-PL62]AMV38782.1 hypothetical protein VT85_15195 [Planctomyces sp. SH-PL62]
MSIPDASVAWLLRRLLSDQPINGELAALAEPWKTIGEHLAELPIDGRGAAWELLSAALPGREAVVAALMNVDPMGDQPPPEPAAADSWGPLRIGETPAVEDFPLDMLPPPARHLAEEASRSIGCPVDFAAGATLAVAAGAIGRSVSLLLKPGYFASSSLFVAVIGKASSGKSPAVECVASPIYAIDRELTAEHAAAELRWKRECEALGPKPKASELPPRPRPRRVDIDNLTLEKLPGLLSDNPRGLLMVRDELSALMGSFGQFKGGRGTDKEDILSAWSGKRIIKDRVGDDNGVPLRSPHPCLSIVGGTVPASLPGFVDPSRPGDGFIERFLFIYPDPFGVPEDEDEDGVSEAATAEWAALVGRLWDRPMNGEHPHVAVLTPDARKARKRLRTTHAREMNHPGFNPSLEAAWGKLSAYADRLALVLGLMEHASDPTADPLAVPDIAERHVENAWRLTAYFKSHARRVRSGSDPTGAGPHAAEVNAIIEWLRDGRRTTFTERDVRRARPWITAESLVKALTNLAKTNAIRSQVAPQGPAGPGRPSSPAYSVNPDLLA